MFRRVAFFIISVLFVFPSAASAFQGYVQSYEGNGTIAWGSGDVAVVRGLPVPGEGANERMSPLLVRRATTQARKQMLDMVMGVRIDSKRTISAYLAGDAELAARVRGAIQNSPFERPAIFDEGGVIRVSESLRGKLAELVLPTTIPFQSGIPPKLSTSMEQSMSFTDNGLEEVGGGAFGYTGVVIDARGLKVTPALAPVVYGQDGVGAYGAFVVSRASAIEYGVLAYATTTNVEALRERVGEKPLTVKALSAYGSWRTDLIISSPMARLIRSIMRPGDIVNNCRVVIVIDAQALPAGDEKVAEGQEQPGEDQ